MLVAGGREGLFLGQTSRPWASAKGVTFRNVAKQVGSPIVPFQRKAGVVARGPARGDDSP
jgi:hypothetical protein